MFLKRQLVNQCDMHGCSFLLYHLFLTHKSGARTYFLLSGFIICDHRQQLNMYVREENIKTQILL